MLKSPERKEWERAMGEKISNIKHQRVWHLVPLPANKTTVSSRWMYNIKKDEYGKIARLKPDLWLKVIVKYKGNLLMKHFHP